MPDATGVAFIIYRARAGIDCAVYAVWSTAKLQPIDSLLERDGRREKERTRYVRVYRCGLDKSRHE